MNLLLLAGLALAAPAPDAFRRDLKKLHAAAQSGDHVKAFTQASIFFKRHPVTPAAEEVENIRQGLELSFRLLGAQRAAKDAVKPPSFLNRIVDGMGKVGSSAPTETDEYKRRKQRAEAYLWKMSEFLWLSHTAITSIQNGGGSVVPEPELAAEHPEIWGAPNIKMSIAFYAWAEFLKAQNGFERELAGMRSASIPANDLKKWEDWRDTIVEICVGSLTGAGIDSLVKTSTRVGLLVLEAGKGAVGTLAGKAVTTGGPATPSDIMTSMLKGAALGWATSRISFDFNKPVEQAFKESGL